MVASAEGARVNQQQLEAITTTEGPLLIIAGPGAGKTYTLVERLVHLITQRNARPEQLMIVTFTDKAAQELRTRISNRLYELDLRFNLSEMYLGTFHSICLRWLQDHRAHTRLKRNFITMDQFDQQFFIYQRIGEYDAIDGIAPVAGDARTQSAWRRSENLLKWINFTSEEALDVDRLLAASDETIVALGHCARLYQRQLEEANALDFSTIQYEALALLRNHPEVQDELRSKIAYVMVDEYQDTNTIQDLILGELVGNDAPNLCVVGDDDQGLYRFRGATIRNILEFEKNFPTGQCKRVALTVNYRSHPAIIDFYNEWITGQDWEHGGQTFRHAKTIMPRDASFPDVPAVIKVGAHGDEAWRQEVLAFLTTLRNTGHLADWNQIAFLFRSVKNEQVKGLAAFLEEHGIPVYSPRANQFFDREEVRLMIGALIFLFPQFPQARQWKPDAQLAIWDYYDRQCFAAFAQAMRLPENNDFLRWARQTAQRHRAMTQNTDYAFSGLFYQMLRFPLFSRYLDADRLKEGLLDSRAMRNLALFSQLLNKFEYLHRLNLLRPEYVEKNLRDLFNQFLRFLHDGGINEYEDEAEYAPSGHVSFLTIHQSKGLEFPIVIVGSLNAVPRKQYSDLDERLERDGYLSRPAFEPLSQTKGFQENK